jgi:hypothetical protein
MLKILAEALLIVAHMPTRSAPQRLHPATRANRA